MTRLLWIVFGLICYRVDRVVARFRPARRGEEESSKEVTGRVVSGSARPHVTEPVPGVWYLHYPGQYAHSLWRSQELTLFRTHRGLLAEPALDFGCGDGTFGSVFLGRSACGVDRDEVALRVARGLAAYDTVVCADGSRLPYRAGSFRSVWANSVLEHTQNPVAVLGELHRVLAGGGRLMVTVPVAEFTRQIARYFGDAEAEYLNRQLDHKQLHDREWWTVALERLGFTIEKAQAYQPAWFTFTYRVLTTGIMSRLLRYGLGRGPLIDRIMPRLVRASVTAVERGANVFIVARKPA